MIIKTGTLEPIVPTGTDWNIEFDCRTKTLKSVSLPLIVSGENNSTVLLIKTPLYYNSVDLTTVNCIVKYKTSWIKEDGSVNEGQVDLTNTATKFDDYIIYTWALDQRQTRLPGKCDFSLKFFMNLNEDPYQNQTRYYLQKISNENGESLQIGKDEMITDIEQKYWSIASLPSSINIGDSGSIAEGVEPDDSMADSGYDDGYNQGYEDGKNSVVDVARTLKSAKFQNLNLFGKTELVLNLDVWESNFQNLFQITSEENRNVTCKHLTINCPYAINSLNQMLYCQYPYTDETLKRLTLNFDTQKCVNYLNAFTQMRALEVIDGKPLDFASVTSASNTNAFPSCASLKEVRFVPNTIKLSISFKNSPNLSTDTIQSIIDGLADLTPRYYVAMQTGPNTYEKGELIENVISVTEYGKDANGETIYNVEYGIDPSNTFSTAAYKEGGGTAQTLTVHQDVRNKLTTEQLAQITDKNWLISPENATA